MTFKFYHVTRISYDVNEVMTSKRKWEFILGGKEKIRCVNNCWKQESNAWPLLKKTSKITI